MNFASCQVVSILTKIHTTKKQANGILICIFLAYWRWIDQEALSETWHEITLDSYIVDIRRVRKHKKLGYGEAIAEVCKYALKFGDLSVEKTWEAYMVLKGDRKVGLRLSGSFGLLRGVKMDDEATTDDDLQEDLPYLEMLYKFVFGKHSYYDLVMTRQVEPQANIERMSEEEGTNDRHDMREIERVAKTDEARTERSGAATQGAECATYRPQQGRKKAHWRIPPATRVRVRQRIRRWDGYLYNIDLFQYVERRLLDFIEGQELDMNEIEKLKKEIEDLKLIIESKNNQVESKNKHIKRLERIISNIKKKKNLNRA